jgi:hypothetical protein
MVVLSVGMVGLIALPYTEGRRMSSQWAGKFVGAWACVYTGDGGMVLIHPQERRAKETDMQSNATRTLTRSAIERRRVDGLDLRHGRATILRRAARKREGVEWRREMGGEWL